jgi:hypothetical protein
MLTIFVLRFLTFVNMNKKLWSLRFLLLFFSDICDPSLTVLYCPRLQIRGKFISQKFKSSTRPISTGSGFGLYI